MSRRVTIPTEVEIPPKTYDASDDDLPEFFWQEKKVENESDTPTPEHTQNDE